MTPKEALQRAYEATGTGEWVFSKKRNLNYAAGRTALCRHMRLKMGLTNKQIAKLTGMTPNAVSVTMRASRNPYFTNPAESYRNAMKGESESIWERSPLGRLYKLQANNRRRVVERLRQDGLSIPDIARLCRAPASTISDILARIDGRAGKLSTAIASPIEG